MQPFFPGAPIAGTVGDPPLTAQFLANANFN